MNQKNPKKMKSDCVTDKYLATHELKPDQIERLLKDIRDIDCEVVEC